ncbi:hypothetical protein [Arenimonas composti]|uniref:DUF3566 domain-containing protein n=1 Tax=Arenimonas composti TR7-09 = DSM 18010 TaxID=1121013 RepID=A0A091BZ44_9GAMM|nr:hypothetical protein [Arenimonas composti]KFN49640.1 hypothetical protein P873_09745 [Arenimonas composti TR7-09 = DSM 18010]
MVIKRIGVISCAKVMGVLYAGIGLLIGLLYALFALVGGGAMMASGASEAAFGGGVMMGIGVAMVVIAPIVYGLMGFLAGLLTAWLYNLAAGFAGGIEIEVA